MNPGETIAAIATPPGRGGIGVLRLSGSKVRTIATEIVGDLPKPRVAAVREFRDGEGKPIDRGLALFFSGPASFTGEDVLELHAHGGPVVMDMLLARALELGARMAAPGEFTQRAFLNDKLDLAQAEAVADLIDSGSQQAARAAMRSLQGEYSAQTQRLDEQLIEARTYVEAAIDFPDEELELLGTPELRKRLEELMRSLNDILANAQQGALLRDGMTVVIAGKPNAGKSSLLNALAGYEAAIVTPIPGTTRDLLRERIAIDGMPLHIIDTAGLRETDDPIEQEGVRRAHEELSKADRVLYVVDSTSPLTASDIDAELGQFSNSANATVIYNKIDLAQPATTTTAFPAFRVSAKTAAGLSDLRQHLKQCMGWQESSATTFSARRRHLDALRRARGHLQGAIENLIARRAGELMAEELRLAQQAIQEITGKFTSEDLLGRIFASFCIGK